MAISLPSIGLGKWNYSDLAFGYRSGVLLNRSWEFLINYNNTYPRAPLEKFNALMCHCWLFAISDKVHRLGPTNRFLRENKRVFYYGAFILFTLNMTALFKKLSNKKLSHVQSKLDKFLIVVWKSTPYLAILTNVALIILELRTHRLKAIVALTTTAISLLDLTSFKPKSFGWYLDVGFRLPIDLVALYYAGNHNRVRIVAGWGLFLAMQKRVQAFFLYHMQRGK